VNFRFEEGSASLDNKARQDLRVLDYIKRHAKTERAVTLVGFGDEKDDPARADLLSKLRAMAVRRELVKTAW
jgi:phosphate transport system substrate-binding protein